MTENTRGIMEEFEEARAARRASILAELEETDKASVRPLRARIVGDDTQKDRERLTELDERAAGLRAELAALAAETEG